MLSPAFRYRIPFLKCPCVNPDFCPYEAEPEVPVRPVKESCTIASTSFTCSGVSVLNLIRRRIRGKKGAQAGIAALALTVDLCTANNTVAIVMAGPIAKEISDEFGVDPKRSASLLDMFTSVGQGLIPYGAQLLSAAALTGLTPYDMIPYLVYPMLMAVCGIAAIVFSRK